MDFEAMVTYIRVSGLKMELTISERTVECYIIQALGKRNVLADFEARHWGGFVRQLRDWIMKRQKEEAERATYTKGATTT